MTDDTRNCRICGVTVSPTADHADKTLCVDCYKLMIRAVAAGVEQHHKKDTEGSE